MDFPEDQKMAAPGSSGDAAWGEDEEDGVHGGVKEAFRSKPRFSYTEVKLLLDEVKKNRHILLKKFNRGVSVDAKKQKWTEITDRINGLGENHREVRPPPFPSVPLHPSPSPSLPPPPLANHSLRLIVPLRPSQTRQIMKKWADLKCDGKRRLLALRGPNGSNLRKKRLGPVERMVHRILMMSPSRGQQLYSCFHVSWPGLLPAAVVFGSPDGGSDQDWSPAEDFPKSLQTGPLMQPPAPYSYLNLNENSGSHGDGLSFDMSPLSSPENEPDELIHSSSEFDQADDEGPSSQDVRQRIRPVFTYSRTHQNQNQKSCNVPPGGAAPPSSSSSSAAASGPPPAPSPPSRPSPTRLSSQSLQQQRAGRLLLGSVSRSLEVLTRSVQLLVESQQEFVQESLQLQRDAVDVLRDFSETALRMLRHKTSSGPPGPNQNPQQNHQQNPPTGSQQQHPASRF
uniref:Myb/SANT-like DNA-binding domain-containing protein n=1 Tax=Poecilia formosa TaxID=48698 RepID=A0A087X453_POEFO